MPDGMGGAGIGAGGGAIAAAIAYALDKAFGSGKTARLLENKFNELKEIVTREHGITQEQVASILAATMRLVDWHNVTDPDDPAGKIWYFSVGLRRTLMVMQHGVDKLMELIDRLIDRFDLYNRSIERLVVVIEALQKDVDGLGVLVASMERDVGRRR
jgi:hypothetical protein